MEYKRTCAICGEEFIATNYRVKVCPKDHYLTCPVCGKEYVHNSTKISHGCSRSCSAKASMDKKRKTNLERYGVENPRQAESIKEKSKQTCLRKYGVENPMSNPDIAKKSRDSRKTSYDEVFEKAKKTWIEHYGVDNPSRSPEIIDKMTDTFMKKYGVKRAMSVPEFREKFEKSMIEKYGVPYYTQTEDYRTNEHFRISKVNLKFAELLEQTDIKYDMEFSIDRKSYDFIVGSTLIEINPSYTHSTVGNHWNKEGLPEDYHLNKTKLAESHGYRCIHIWDWDDIDKVIDLIRLKVKIGARKCEIYRINPKVGNEFLERYHLQGSCRGQLIYLGLVYDDKLVQLMTFGKPRYNKKYTCELLRLCTKSGYSIVGGASKLFKWALEHHELGDIISYCDRSKFSGSVYFHMGMSLKTTTPPQEVWSRDGEYITANLLRQRGYDQLFGTSYGRGTSNDLLMLQHGWLPIYDCGQSVYEFKQ